MSHLKVHYSFFTSTQANYF